MGNTNLSTWDLSQDVTSTQDQWKNPQHHWLKYSPKLWQSLHHNLEMVADIHYFTPFLHTYNNLNKM